MYFHFPIKQLSRLVFALSLAMTLSGMSLAPVVQAQGGANLSQFDLLTANSGWILLDGHLFWTSNAGQAWSEIGPSLPSDATIQDIKFTDANNGWVLWTTLNADGSSNFQLAQTTDNGATWKVSSLSLFQMGDVASYAEKAEMSWFDSQTGWISVKQSSGSNFSIGTLFRTSDGGSSWRSSPLPVAEEIYFSDPQNGWAIGGPSGDQTFNTPDAGATWKNMSPADMQNNIQAKAYTPFVSDGRGLMVMTALGAENSLNVYSLENVDHWLSVGQVKLDTQPGQLGLSILDPQNFVATIPGTRSIVRMKNGRLNVLENKDGLAASIVELDMFSLDRGWAKSIDSRCVTESLSDPKTASVSCSSSTRLLRTNNGGITWQVVNLPFVKSSVASLNASGIGNTMTTSTAAASGNTVLFAGQGFDSCEIPTLSQMQTWSANSPYKTVNLYIGGSSRACDNTALISSYLFLLYQQGWKFFPTWVGPQAPCTGFSSRMSSDVTTAYTQGVNEANLAVDRLAALGLTGPDKTGSVVYYDIENYGTNATCRNAVNSFMNGWVSQLHARGNMAGVYGSTLCNTGLSDFLNIANIPDVIWPARWYHNLGSGYYDPTASVWNLGSCLPNTAWANHQRIRQYEGDHNETWGNLTMEIDSDVLDGVVAIPYDYPFVSNILRKDLDLTHASSVGFTVNFSKSVTGVNKADFALATSGVTGASISTVSGSGAIYTVTVNTGSGNGTIRLNLTDDDSIKDANNNSLGGTGLGNGNFSAGEMYTIVRSANVNITIGNTLMGNFSISPNLSIVKNYPNTLNGPVKIVNKNGGPIFTSQRVTSGDSYNELLGMPSNQFTTEYWFPYYDHGYPNVAGSNMRTWILVGNPSSTTSANVQIYIGGVLQSDPSNPSSTTFSIAPGANVTPRWVGKQGGPVHVVSDIPVFASERVFTSNNNAFNESLGYASADFASEYWFPWYDNVNMKTSVVVGNTSSNQAANVDIYIGGVLKGSYSIPANGTRFYPYASLIAGPVQVVSANGVNIVTSLNSVSGPNNSFSDVLGVPSNQFTTEYWFPYYDHGYPNVTGSNMRTWILVGNPSGTTTANVQVYIAGVLQSDPGNPSSTTFSIAPGANVTPRWIGTQGGPVRVVSDIPVFASERVFTTPNSIFNEMLGYPSNQLTSEYWYPWYDSVNMNNDILIGNP